MLMNEIIGKKRDGLALTTEEINFVISGYVKGSIPDYQVSALLMAIVLKGMDARETTDLTMAMLHSGDTIDMSRIKGPKVDKHSTGGVGDKTSLVLGPMVASCGAKVAKMSGRGLGHTGGTLDKLESIPGMRIDLSISEFEKQVNKVGLAIIGQTGDLVPADKKLYALRDVTGTVKSVSLVASSIMSKKLATGSDSICLDVKYGSGAFFDDPKDAEKLARAMVAIGDRMHKDTRAELTNMNQPLGLAVGNILEVQEAIATLKGHGPKDLVELCLGEGSVMLVQAKLFKTYAQARKALLENLNNGKAFEYLRKMVIAQHGDVTYIDNPDKFAKAKHIVAVPALRSGYVSAIDALQIGLTSMELGAGRARKEDPVDYTAGIVLTKKVGDKVNKGEVIAYLHTNHAKYQEQLNKIEKAFAFSPKKVSVPPIIRKVIA